MDRFATVGESHDQRSVFPEMQECRDRRAPAVEVEEYENWGELLSECCVCGEEGNCCCWRNFEAGEFEEWLLCNSD